MPELLTPTYPFFLLVIGFITLIKSSDFLIDGSSSIAKRFNISNLVIGLTVVSIGTTTPELAVSVFSAIQGKGALAIGNVTGSIIVNILLVLGIAAVICPIVVEKVTIRHAIPFNLLAALVVWVIASDMSISRVDGLILFSFFVAFVFHILMIKKGDKDEGKDIEMFNLRVSVVYILIGVIGLFIGGKWVMDGAISVASSFGLSESVIGLTILAIGTSLPELATSITAGIKKEQGIAIGNVVGANILNLSWVLGVTSIIRPITIPPNISFDFAIVIFVIVFLLITLNVGKKHTLGKIEGIVFLIIYTAYIGSMFVR